MFEAINDAMADFFYRSDARSISKHQIATLVSASYDWSSDIRFDELIEHMSEVNIDLQHIPDLTGWLYL